MRLQVLLRSESNFVTWQNIFLTEQTYCSVEQCKAKPVDSSKDCMAPQCIVAGFLIMVLHGL